MRKTIWRMCCIAATALSIVAFTPLVISPGRYEPTFAGMPRTLWAGILVSLGLAIVTIVASRFAGGDEDRGEE